MLNSQKFFKYIPFSKKIFTSYNLCKSWSGQRIGLTLGLASAIALSHHSVTLAQTKITGLTGDYESGPTRNYSTTTADACQDPYTTCGKNINMEFGVGATNNYRVRGFTSGAGSYSLINLADDIKFRRINNANVTGERQLMLFERTTDSTGARIRSSYANNMEVGLLSDIANRGIDNAFSNDNSVASNNIERIDYIISNGLDVPTAVRSGIGFLILERGGNDSFKIAAITSLDANGNPASFAPLRNVNRSTWGRVGPTIPTSVMRREQNELNFRPSHTVPEQTISGIYISLSDLNLPAGQTVYGYALFPDDITATSSNDLVNLTGFPTDTTGASEVGGGLDLMAGGGIYLADNLHTVSGTLYRDANRNKAFNNGEATLPNGIEVILYRDTNGDGNYNSNVDERVQTNSTARGNGGYNFIGVADGTYRVFVNTNDPDIPSNLVLGTPNNTQVVVSGSNRTAINFGFNPPTDYGDAPVSYDDTADNNNLINANDNPARHAIAPNLHLGSIAPDAEAAPQSSPNANGDDNATAPAIDDEDAFTNLPNVTATGNYSLDVPVTNTSGGNATLHGWVDFNKNGKFELGEYQSAVVNNNTSPVKLTWAVPAGTTPGNTNARFRLTSDASVNGNTPNGAANNGEVEDYPVAIVPAPLYDYGDAPDASAGRGTGNYKTRAADGGAAQVVINTAGRVLSIGNNIDIDNGSLQNSNADADDTSGSTPDDEDGVSSFPTLTTAEGQTYTVTVTAKNNVPAVPAYLVGFIDFNKDGDFEDTREKSNIVTIASDANLTGTSGQLRSFNVTFITPAGMTPGDTYARFRLGQVQATAEQATGASAGTDNGEVEDYKIAIATKVTVSGTVYEDFGAGGDNNNTFDSREETIGNVTVNLFEDNNNDNQPDGAAVQTVETDASTGGYQFIDVASGRYLIRVDTRDGDIPSTYAIGTPNPIQINISNADITDRNFGFNTVSKTCPTGSFLSEQTFLNFQNPVAEPGTTNGNYNVGAVYRFPNVTTDIDALVEITSLNNATLTQIDINNFGVQSAFQPQVRANSTNQGQYSVDFDIDFVQSGTNIPVELRRVLATGIDIDGDSGRVREASELGGNQFTTYAIDNNSRLTATELSPDRVKFESTTNFNLADITVNSLNQGSAYYDNNTQSIEYRAGLIIDSGTATNPANQRLTSLLFDCVSYDLAVTRDPNLLLVKRITAINPGQSEEVRFNSFIDDPNTSNDNAQNWPNNDNIYLPGRINVANVEPGEEVEYTIYFLSFGGKPATNVKICDVVPDNMSFVADSNNSNSGIAFLNSSAAGATPTNLTNAADTDEGTFYAPGIAPPTVGNSPTNLCQKVDSTGNMVSVGAAENINGAIVVEIDSLPEATAPGIPENSYGFIRFRAKVQ